MEITANDLQSVASGQSIMFTETPVSGSNCIIHREGSGVITLRGLTNQCNARFLVSFSGNVQIPTGGTAEAISMAIAVDGEALQSATMSVVPAAVENLWNISAQCYVSVPRNCCVKVSVENTSTQTVETENASLIVTRVA